MNSLYDLHSHLYGCLEIEDLYWLHSRNKPRFEIFTSSWKKTYGTDINTSDLFAPPVSENKKLRNIYHLNQSGSFQKFQVAFDLIIALSSTDEDELKEITKRVMQREKATYAEYRMMFSPFEKKESYQKKTIAICEAMHYNQTNLKSCKLILSISREPENANKQYNWIKETQAINSHVNEFLVGIDFCAVEEGFPPEMHLPIVNKILKDNEKNPNKALIITYHVGESFQDKSVEGAIRWILEAASMGCHRLGHALALGIPASFFLNTTRRESAQERNKLIQYKIKHHAELKSYGYNKTIQDLKAELKNIENSDKACEIFYDEQQINNLNSFQNWALQKIQNSEVVIESCPKSNLYVGALESYKNHPLKRFLDAELNVVIGSDDSGIFQNNIEQEFENINSWGLLSKQNIKTLIENAEKFCAMKMLQG